MPAPTDRVQLLKRESTALGGQDADERDWPVPINPQQDGVEALGVFLQDASNRDEAVYIARAGGRAVVADTASAESPIVTEIIHAALRQLVHLADGVGGPWEAWASGSYREILPAASVFPTSIIWWTDNTKTKKIVAKSLTYTASKMPATIQWAAYDSDGLTVIATVTDTMTYSSSIFETSRTRTVT